MTQDGAQALRRLTDEMERPPFHGLLRPEPVSADPATGTVVVRLPWRPEFTFDPGGPHIHGGVIAALIDLCAHAAVAVLVGHRVPTVDLRIDYLRSAGGPALLATGRVLRSGRLLATADVAVADADGRAVAVGRGTFVTRVDDAPRPSLSTT